MERPGAILSATAFLAVLAAVPAPLFAQAKKPPEEADRLARLFEKLDKNGDGKLDAQEAGSPELVKRWDRDGDGFATLEEIRAAEAKAEEPAQDAGAPLVTVERCKLAAEYSAAHRGVSVLVMLDGKVFFEDYANGGAPDRAWELASGTKSFNGVLAAAAIQDGWLSLDEKVCDTIAEWKDDPRKSRITLRHLLSLTAGLETGKEGGDVPTYAEAVAKPAVTEPGEAFKYGAVPFQVFGELVRRKLADKGESPVDYLKRRVFAPIGLEFASWRKGSDGNPHMPSGAQLTARDWAKFGEFVRLGGTWEGKEVVRKELLDPCFVGSKVNPVYGLTWWLNQPPPGRLLPEGLTAAAGFQRRPGIPRDLAWAGGAGNQRCYVSPSLKLVVVRQAFGVVAALAGARGEWADVQFLSRLLFGTDAEGKPVALGEIQPEDGKEQQREALAALIQRFDKDGDGRLNDEERAALREFLRTRGGRGR
ncbi:MAG: serine hydrolase [Planctomycetes bacterium]|nr:serine hydrolase [Planctomycetota bacterium]